jgi:hypothetical protein
LVIVSSSFSSTKHQVLLVSKDEVMRPLTANEEDPRFARSRAWLPNGSGESPCLRARLLFSLSGERRDLAHREASRWQAPIHGGLGIGFRVDPNPAAHEWGRGDTRLLGSALVLPKLASSSRLG